MSAKRLTISAFFMALVIILSSSLLSIPVPGGHFYFNGIIIFLVGLIFPPTEAVIIAGVGSFIGDFLFYPLPFPRAFRIIFFILFAADGDDKRSRNSRRERKQPPKLKRSHNSDGNERHRRHALKNAEKRSALLRRTDGKARVQRARQRKIQKNETDNESVCIHITIKPSDRGRSRRRPYLISFSAPRWRG